jgi:DNA-binding NtrC family response regulator
MKVLLLDNEPGSRGELRAAFAEAGCQVRCVDDVASGRKQLVEYRPEIVVAALDLGPAGGAAFLAEALKSDPRGSVYALVPADRLEAATEALDRGAHDFLWRPVSRARVSWLLASHAERQRREEEAERARLSLARAETAASLPGRSLVWRAALQAAEKTAASGLPVLLMGEAGTEKEALARALHRLSPRGAEPFVIAPEGEGFAAVARRAGRGSLFVPGIEKASAAFQRDLLAGFESSSGPAVVLAADEDPEAAAAGKRLLPELLDALRDRRIHLPPLRERGEDVGLLAGHYLREEDLSLSFDAEAMEALAAHDWPGNLRELKEAVHRASRLAEGPVIGATVVRSVLGRPLASKRSRRKKAPVVRIAVGDSLADVERRLIQKTLEFARGNKKKTAELLKLSLKTIYNKIKEYGLEH